MNSLRQIGTLIGLKAKLTFRSYSRDTLAVVQSIFFALFILVFAVMLAFGVVFSFLAMREFLPKESYIPVMLLANLLWAIYGLWILFPVFGFRMNESYDISKLLHLPVKRSTLFIANILGNFADLTIAIPIAALTGILLIFAIDQSLGTFDPLVFMFNAVVLSIFLINMIVCGQLVVITIYNIIPRVPLWRILLYIVITVALIAWAWFALQEKVKTVLSIFDIEVGLYIYVYFPHGQATIATYCASYHDWHTAFTNLGWLVIHTAAISLLTGFLFARWYAGGNIEGTSIRHGISHRSFADYVSAFWVNALRRFLPAQALEIMRKDHLNLLRNRSFLLYKSIPAVIGPGIIMFAIWYSTTNYEYIRRDSVLLGCFVNTAIIFSGFVITAQASLFSGNIFGLEGRGIYSLFTTGIDKRIVLIGKDAFLLTLFLFDAFVYGCFTWLLLGSFIYGLMAFLILFNFFILLMASGNFASAILPYYYDLERPAVSAQQVILTAVVEAVSAMVSAILLLPALLLLVLPFIMHLPIILILFAPLALGYSFLWLWVSIRFAGPLVERLQQNIMLKVSES